MIQKVKGLVKGLEEGFIQTIELIPGLSILVESARAYKDEMESQHREIFLRKLARQIKSLQDKFTFEWFATSEGQEFSRKLIASALNTEFSDKIEYFVNAFCNAPSSTYNQDERIKFIEILRQVSKPSLKILAFQYKLFLTSSLRTSRQINHSALIQATNMSPYIVESCVNELYFLGVFSHTVKFSDSGMPSESYSEGTPAHTELTTKFIKFITDSNVK